jgi:deoxyribodipyrimidine photo-lyase
MIHEERIKKLNDRDINTGEYVLYWMQSSVRIDYNHALEYAVRKANDRSKPLIACFEIHPYYPEGNLRHYTFMFEGLMEVNKDLKERGIPFILEKFSKKDILSNLYKEAILVVTDRGYTKFQRKWRRDVANNINCPLIQVESDVVVPIEKASNKEEYAARTIRPKIKEKLDRYLVPLRKTDVKYGSKGKKYESCDLSDPIKLAEKIGVDVNVKPVEKFHGGPSSAKKHLKLFIDTKLDDYNELRNDPTKEMQSNLSPYIHFGQISPLDIALEVDKVESPGKEAFLEELIIRRELAINYVYFNPDYDKLKGLPEWARKTLEEHEGDPREYKYTFDEFEAAETHDPYWNAAQEEMVITGKMHGYMRMYWGKKILEWSKNPEIAFDTALRLNNKYELDGRNPNSYTGVAWCFGKHDRAWKERPIYGKVRYMNARGLERKFNIEDYVEKIRKLKGKSMKNIEQIYLNF